MKKNKLGKKYIFIGLGIICLFFILNFLGLFDNIKMKLALENKYHEKFVVKGLNISFFNNYNFSYAYSKSYPNLLFKVYYKDKESDNYVKRRITYKLSNEISDNLKKYLNSDFYVFSQTMLSGTTIENPNLSVEEFLEIEKSEKMNILLILNQTNLNIKNLENALNHSLDNLAKFNGNMAIYITDSKLFNEAKNYLETHDEPYFEFNKMMDNSYLKYYEINNGSILISSYDLEKSLKEKNIVLN